MARIFFAGAENSTHLEALLTNGATNILFSFFYLNRRGQMQKALELLDEARVRPKLFLDSGAFSFREGTARISLAEAAGARPSVEAWIGHVCQLQIRGEAARRSQAGGAMAVAAHESHAAHRSRR